MKNLVKCIQSENGKIALIYLFFLEQTSCKISACNTKEQPLAML